MPRRLASARDLAILVEAHHLRLAAQRGDSEELVQAGTELSEHLGRAIDAIDGAEALGELRAAATVLAVLRAGSFAALRREQITAIVFDHIAVTSASCRREIDALAVRLRGRAWLRLTSGGVEECGR